MTIEWSVPRKVAAALCLAGLGVSLASPAGAQDDARLRRIESEIKALQRVVFPNGGDSRFFTPEVTPGAQPQAQPANPGATPSPTALTDVLARLDALESQVQRLTARSEENAHALAELEKRFDDAQAALAAQTPAPSPAPSGVIPPSAFDTPAPTPSPTATAPRSTPTPAPAASTPRPAPTPAATTNRLAPAPTPTGRSTPAPTATPSAARLAAVRAIAKPQTDDPGDDEYSYGYRLFDAGYFPEARQQLSLFLEKYPNHQRVSYARNLLGRAYLDDGQPREAAKYFFENYQSSKQGARAADSLLYLADSMIAIGDNNRACIALAEFGDTYPALATGRLKEQYDRTKNKVRCSS